MDWWWRREFFFNPQKNHPYTNIRLDGIDGQAEIYMNGEMLVRTENAFRPCLIDVTHKIKNGSVNVLLIRFLSIDRIMGGPRLDELGGWYDRRSLMRKPQFSFGWDWSLPLPSIGIAGAAQIEQHAGARLTDVSIRTFISGRLDFKFQVNQTARDAGYYLNVRICGHGVNIEKKIERPGFVHSYAIFFIENPRLWWPNGLGEPALYEYEVRLTVNGKSADVRTGRIGIRETRIVEEPFTEEAGPGISFWLEINGRRVFCKGGNWVPMELWPATATEEQYRFYLRKTAEAGFNIQRVWGGGIYERDIFYNLCDELGIMVWQDFMFASTGYPVDRLRTEIIAEAEYQIKRLRSHACIIIWCGCNEDVFSWSLPNEKAVASADTGIYGMEGAGVKVNRLRDDPQIYTMILRGLVSRHGLGVPYVESSPQSHDDAGNMPESGNSHLSCWKFALFETLEGTGGQDVRRLFKTMKADTPEEKIAVLKVKGHPELFRLHFENACSFNSEFCIQGPSDVHTMKQFLPPGHQWPPDDIWTYHLQRGHENLPHHEQTMFIAGTLFGKIDSLQKYVKYGQAAHAEMMRAEFESARRDRPNNGGTMLWMFNDCWPTSNWSIIDYYRRPKPCYYAAKRACAEFLPIIFERNGQVEYFFSNDGCNNCLVNLTCGQETLAGRIIWRKEYKIEVAAGQTLRFHSMPRSELLLHKGDFLFISARANKKQIPCITYFPCLWKNLNWPAPVLHLKITRREKEGTVWKTRLNIKT